MTRVDVKTCAQADGVGTMLESKASQNRLERMHAVIFGTKRDWRTPTRRRGLRSISA